MWSSNNWPEDELEYLGRCPVCGNDARDLLYKNLTDRVFRVAPGYWKMYECKSCGSAYIDPRPTEKSVALAYDNYYTHLVEDDQLPKSRFLLLRRALKNGFVKSIYPKFQDKPLLRLGRLLFLLPGYATHLKRYFRNLPSPEDGNTLLDVGCGNGSFLRIAKQIGYESFGLECDTKAIEAGKKQGATVWFGCLPNTGIKSDSFDVITLNHVLEHLHNPFSSLAEIKRLLKKGGLVWIATPNFSSMNRRLWKSDFLHLDPPRHLIIYTKESLRWILEESGFIDIHFYRPSLSSSTYLNSFLLSKGRDPFRQGKLPLSVLLRSLIDKISYLYLNVEQLDELIIVARKP